MLEKGSLVLLFGQTSVYKSLIGIDLGCSIATGTDWFGRIVQQMPVLYLKAENNNPFIRRLVAWEKRDGVNLENFYFGRNIAVLDDGDEAELKREIPDLVGESNKPIVLIIDTLARNFGTGNEDSAEDARRFYDTLRRAAGPDSLVIVIHHTGWHDTNRPRGSKAISELADVVCFQGGKDQQLSGKGSKISSNKKCGRE